MSQKDFQKDSFVEAVTTAARYFAERWWDGGGQPTMLLAPALPAEPEGVLTRTEAAKEMKVSPTTVTRMRSEGVLNPIKELLPVVRYRKEDVQKLIQKRR
jgi:hypothetical protein